jgi:hypothetical protein
MTALRCDDRIEGIFVSQSRRKIVSTKTAFSSAIQFAKRFVKPTSAVESCDDGTPPSEEAIRTIAYLRWDAAGRPGGDGVKFWMEAEKEILQGK